MSSDSLSSSSRSTSPAEQILDDSARSDTMKTPNTSADASHSVPVPTVAASEPGTTAAPIAIPADDAALTRTAAPISSSSISRDRTAPTADSHSRKLTDGRVRNPVPSKLLNKTSNKNGNFAVMSMNVRKQPLMDERDLAAKRSSEATQAAALKMSQDYAATKRRYNTPLPNNRPEYTPASSQQARVHYPAMPPPPPPPAPASYSQQPPPWLSPAEIKTEQARLLTLLRTLHPNKVVEQICKALAFFGGIPEAPPPLDINEGLPHSAQGNGSGAQFVGWLSEIFPSDERRRKTIPNNTGGIAIAPGSNPAPPTNGVTPPSSNAIESGQPEKRRRGRPKGSKGSNPRKDKGIKKGPKVPAPENVNDSNTTSAPAAQVNGEPASTEAHPQAQQPQAQHPTSSAVEVQSNTTALATSSDPPDPDSSMLSTPGTKKRGRPKGSKNKPKPVPSAELPSSQANVDTRPSDSQESPTPNPRANVNSSQPPYAPNQGIQRTGSESEATLSQHAQYWIDPPLQSPQQLGQSNDQGSGDNSKKRKATHQVQNSGLTSGQVPKQSPQAVDGTQAPTSKRRRTEQEGRPASAMSNMDSQPSSSELSVSPAMNPRMPNMTTTASASGSFSSNSSGSRPPMHSGSGQLDPQAQQHFQQQVGTANAIQPQQNSSMPRKNLPGSFNRQQAVQQPQQQTSYAQQQAPNQRAHPGHQANNFGNNPGLSNNITMAQMPNNHGQPYHPDFLNAQYSMSANRAVQQQSNPAAFGGQTHLGAALPESGMPYQQPFNQ